MNPDIKQSSRYTGIYFRYNRIYSEIMEFIQLYRRKSIYKAIHPFKVITSHYKLTCSDIKGFVPIYIYIYIQMYML